MSTVYIESAASYAGRENSAIRIRENFLRNVITGRNSIAIDNKYTIVNGLPYTTGGFTLLRGYDYQLKGESAVTGCIFNGKTKVKALKDCLQQIGEIHTPGNFYIINANSAHHFSYVLSKCAFYSQIRNDGAMNRKKVVVNIDNHVDYGKYVRDKPNNQENIDCGRWGGHHLGFWSVHCVAGAEYVSLRCGSEMRDNKKNMVHSVRGSGQRQVTTTSLANVERTILNHLRTYRTATHDVYLTVDRDFMLDNGTKYLNRGCMYNNRDGMQFVQNCINAINTNCSILSADIIGLPTNGDRVGARHPGLEDPDAVRQMSLAIENVKSLASWL